MSLYTTNKTKISKNLQFPHSLYYTLSLQICLPSPLILLFHLSHILNPHILELEPHLHNTFGTGGKTTRQLFTFHLLNSLKRRLCTIIQTMVGQTVYGADDILLFWRAFLLWPEHLFV